MSANLHGRRRAGPTRAIREAAWARRSRRC